MQDSYIKIKSEKSKKIKADIEAWLKKGGKVYKAAIGETGEKHKVLSAIRVSNRSKVAVHDSKESDLT